MQHNRDTPTLAPSLIESFYIQISLQPLNVFRQVRAKLESQNTNILQKLNNNLNVVKQNYEFYTVVN
jgi:hypothetical protein